MNSLKKSDKQPFAQDGGIRLPPDPPVDPFQSLDDLMAAVEALCPTWPERETFVKFSSMLL